MRRVAAIAAAMGMVVVAILVRSAIDEDDEGGNGGDDRYVVVCAADLLEACEALEPEVEVRSEAAAETAAALAAGEVADDVDAWITTTAWLEVAQSRAEAALGDERAIATSPTVVATDPDRREAINDLCADDGIWRCLGDNAGTDWSELGGPSSWGTLKVGMPDGDSALGLPVIASASAGYFGAPDFATNDLEAGEFEPWLANLTDPSGGGDPNPARTMATRRGSYSAVGDVHAIVKQLESRGVSPIEPHVAVSATVAIVELKGGDGLPGTNPVQDALSDAGWATANADDLAPTLKPGVMAALHTLWRDVTS